MAMLLTVLELYELKPRKLSCRETFTVKMLRDAPDSDVMRLFIQVEGSRDPLLGQSWLQPGHWGTVSRIRRETHASECSCHTLSPLHEFLTHQQKYITPRDVIIQ